MTTPTLFPVQGLSDTLGTYADLRLLHVSVGVMHWAWPNQPTLGSFRVAMAIIDLLLIIFISSCSQNV